MQAQKAYELDEIPVGAIVINDGKIIGKAVFRYWPFDKIGPIGFLALNNLY